MLQFSCTVCTMFFCHPQTKPQNTDLCSLNLVVTVLVLLIRANVATLLITSNPTCSQFVNTGSMRLPRPNGLINYMHFTMFLISHLLIGQISSVFFSIARSSVLCSVTHNSCSVVSLKQRINDVLRTAATGAVKKRVQGRVSALFPVCFRGGRLCSLSETSL